MHYSQVAENIRQIENFESNKKMSKLHTEEQLYEL